MSKDIFGNTRKTKQTSSFGYSYQIYYNCYITDREYHYTQISTRDQYSSKILEADKTLYLLLSNHYINKVEDINDSIEKATAANVYIKYKLLENFENIKKKQTEIKNNIDIMQKLLTI